MQINRLGHGQNMPLLKPEAKLSGQALSHDAVLFSGKKRKQKKLEGRLIDSNYYLGNADKNKKTIEEAFSDKAIDKQLRINEFLGLTPKKYLNKMIAAAYADIENLKEYQKLRAEYYSSSDNELIDESGLLGQFENETEIFEGHQQLIRDGIEKLEKLKKERFGIENRFDPEGGVFKRFGQKHLGGVSKRAKTGTAGMGLYIGAYTGAIVLLGPLAGPFVIMAYVMGDGPVQDKLQRERLEKAYLNEIDIALQDIVVDEMVFARLPEGSVGVVEVEKRTGEPDEMSYLISAPSEELGQKIEAAVKDDINVLFTKKLLSNKQKLNISVVHVSDKKDAEEE